MSFTSGKGGVGKTHIVVNLAYALQRLGARVMVLDADLGLANVDVLLGLAPRFNIQHVLAGQKTLADVLVAGPAGMMILPASSGVQDLVQLTEGQRLQLLAELDALETQVDFLLVDTGAGISANVMYFNMAAQEIVVVVTPEPTSMTDAYALMKVLSTKYAEKNFKVMLNAVDQRSGSERGFSPSEYCGRAIPEYFTRLSRVCGVRRGVFAGCTSAEAFTGIVSCVSCRRLLS